MLYLVTGSNGTGKTLNTLKWVRDLQLRNPERQVFYNGRFKLKSEKESEFGWSKFDFKDWQDLPDGSIVLVDEAHNDLPVRPAGQKPPEYIAALAEHRSRGFDFFLISQHPSNIDGFVRRLIGAPGWHRHLKRPFGRDAVTCLEFDAVNLQAEKPGQSKTAVVKRISFPKDVYGWYDSAVMHTGKKTIPKQFWILLGGVVLIPLLFFFALSLLPGKDEKSESSDSAASPAASSAASSGGDGGGPLSKEDWLAAHVPRIDGLPHTAPRYDKITEPVRAPVPAACIHMASKGCKCFTQQGTLLPSVTGDLCLSIVRRGYFVDFDPDPEVRHQSDAPIASSVNQPLALDMPDDVAAASGSPAGHLVGVASVSSAYRDHHAGRVDPRPW